MKTVKSIEAVEAVETLEILENLEMLNMEEKIETEDTGEIKKTADLKDVIPAKAGTDARTFTTDFILILHTAPSYVIFTGEWAPGKMGLVQFGRYVQMLWQGYEQEDPYAEWQLLRIYEAIQSLKRMMDEQEVLWRKQVRGLRGIQVKPFRNAKPFSISLTSVSILVLMAGSLITQADYLTRQILILKQMGIVPQGQARSQQFCEEIQKIFMLSQEWKHTGITRQDILDNNDLAKKVETKLGQLPENILFQKTSLPFLCMEE